MRRITPLRRIFLSISTFRRITVSKPRPFCTQTPSTSTATAGALEAAKYEKKSPLEHVLLRPDTYIGGCAMRENVMVWMEKHENGREMVLRELNYPPGLLKIFDEILVNAADNKARDSRMDRLEVTLEREPCRISVWNNGKGLPVELHPHEGIYVPSLVFGNLFTSSNYDDSEIKTVGGRNGYGAKLCNIFSNEFIVETVDTTSGRRFRQRWYNNMKNCDPAEISPISPGDTDFTKVTFSPDLTRFHVAHLTDDVIALIRKRVVEVAATLPRGVQVIFNGRNIEMDGFEEYVKAFDPSAQMLFLHPSPRWHVGVAKRTNGGGESERRLPKFVSFVNNINTEKGGSHVDYVTEKMVNVLKKTIDKQLEQHGKTVKPAVIRTNLSVFVNALIENPSFESQTKETLTTRYREFGSVFELDSEKLQKWAESSGLIDEIIDEVLHKPVKKPSANRRNQSESVRDIVKLEDAAWAGLPHKSKECTLILTEGDSAKALALAGLEVLGRERYGVFPLKGKLLNVANLEGQKAAKNEEIGSLMRILGLKFDLLHQEGITVDQLRYGKVMILADQDEDGSHIKGLVVNFLHRFWPQLIRNQETFIQSFRTPLLKARRADEIHSFFSMSEYEKWAESVNVEKYKIKYYKGLGTSTSNEARQYFGDLEKHTVNFKYVDSEDEEAIRMVFDREQTDERKQWIREAEESRKDTEKEDSHEFTSELRYKRFVDGELIQFGMADLRRSIPCLMDGLKPSQRKILWTLLQMDSSVEMKVSQLAGAVAHSQSYHHGEDALVRTIIRMGQTICGGPNLPLLEPIGQFGTRHEGGNDAASARYIFTALAPTTRLLFPEVDDTLLERKTEEGIVVEPKWLCPIIPLILVNGAEGIGTGWSTKIANRNPDDVIDLMRRKIDNREEATVIQPYYEGFQGRIEMVTPTRFMSYGKVKFNRQERKNASTFTVEISELPIGIWTSKYKEKLSKMLEPLNVVEFSEHHTEKRVNFRLIFDRKVGGVERKMQKFNSSELIEYFKLRNTFSENPTLFDAEGKLREFENVVDVSKQFFEIRKSFYERRLERQTMESERRLRFVENQLRFIEMVTNGTIEMRLMSREELEHKLIAMEFQTNPMAENGKKRDFSYLLEMPLSRLTSEEMSKLGGRAAKRAQELEAAKRAEWRDTWHLELDRLAEGIQKFRKKI